MQLSGHHEPLEVEGLNADKEVDIVVRRTLTMLKDN